MLAPGGASRSSSALFVQLRGGRADVDRVLGDPRRPDRHAARGAGPRDGVARLRDRGRDRRLPAHQADPALAGRARQDASSRSADGRARRPGHAPDRASWSAARAATRSTTTHRVRGRVPRRRERLRGRLRRAEHHDTARALIIGLVYVLLWEGRSASCSRAPGSCRSGRRRSGSSAGLGGQVDAASRSQIGHRRRRPDDRHPRARSSLTSWRLARFEVRGRRLTRLTVRARPGSIPYDKRPCIRRSCDLARRAAGRAAATGGIARP